MNYLFKIFLIIFILFIIKCLFNKWNESFINIDKVNMLINNDDMYTYNYTKINEVIINELAYKIEQECKKNKVLRDKINTKIMKIYEDSKINTELKDYLKFANLMNDDNNFFFNDLFSNIKVILILMPIKDLKLNN